MIVTIYIYYDKNYIIKQAFKFMLLFIILVLKYGLSWDSGIVKILSRRRNQM
jgi:hypothetical protein